MNKEHLNQSAQIRWSWVEELILRYVKHRYVELCKNMKNLATVAILKQFPYLKL